MFRLFFLFLLLLASVVLGITLAQSSGYLLIAINHWTIETNLWVATFMLIALFILGYLLLLGTAKLCAAPKALHEWRIHQLSKKAQATTRKGLIEYSEGHWKEAKNHLIQALPNSDTPLINYLTAARAAQKMGENQLRDLYLREAQQSMPEAKIAVGLTQAQLQLANHQWEQALATLKHLHDLAPQHPYVLKLLMNLYQEIHDWPELIKILPQLTKHRLISAEELRRIECHAYLQLLLYHLKQNQAAAIHDFFQSLPKPLAQDPSLLSEYTGFLIRSQEEVKAEKLLRNRLNKGFDANLINLYGQLQQPDKKHLDFAESLLAKNAHSGALYLCLGRLCMTQNLWGKAKEYLEQAKLLQPTPIVFAVLGGLYEKLEQPALACKNFKQGLNICT